MADVESVDSYVERLPEVQRPTVAAVRDLVNAHLPPGYDETIRWGMISWEVPLSRYAQTYNGQPLGAVALAGQKRYTSLYLMCAYIEADGEESIRRAYAAAGKRVDLGKSCLRFKNLDGFLAEAVVPLLERTTVDAFIARYETARGQK